MILLESLVYELNGQPYEAAQSVAHVHSHTSGIGNLEVMFFFEGDLDLLEHELSTMGDCLVIARNDERSGKVHIHSTEAGAVIECAFARGTVTQLHLEVLPDEPVTQTPTRLVIAVTPPDHSRTFTRRQGQPPSPRASTSSPTSLQQSIRPRHAKSSCCPTGCSTNEASPPWKKQRMPSSKISPCCPQSGLYQASRPSPSTIQPNHSQPQRSP